LVGIKTLKTLIMKLKITPQTITKLKKNEVFVFGSNLNGDHLGGAAKLALDKFGAINGQAFGIQGQSFAIPTLDKQMVRQNLWDLEEEVKKFAFHVHQMPDKHFLLTEIGCGIAGFSPQDIAPLFAQLFKDNPKNISWPRRFVDILSKPQPIRGYKVTGSDMSCRGYKYSLNVKYQHTGVVSPCNSGFHYCVVAADCFDYYSFDPNNRVFEILDHGTPVIDGNKSCTSEIEFIRELTWLEVLTIVNMGKDNTGLKNTGDWNTGDRNTGDWNTGNWNTGDRNTGDRNTGDSNTGDSNTGDWNTGDWNTGDSNTGYRNTGDRNTGDSNTGYRNTGDRNTGDSNTGDWNTGDRNTGDSNTGNWNTGDRNTGDSNTGYRNGGAFCTDLNPKLILFNIQTDILVKDWERHEACQIMNSLTPNIWVYSSEMTADEKTKFPTHETTGGYLKSISMHEAWSNLWHNLTDKKKKVFTTLPHFSSKLFLEITGIDVIKENL
jgi:hypothetical protein